MPLAARLTRIRALLCTLVVFCGLLEFMQGYSRAPVYFGGAVALVALPVIFPLVSKSTRVIVSILLLGGMAAAISSGNLELGLLVESFNEMSPLVALVAAAMLLGMALQLGRFAALFNRFYTCTARLYRPYIISLLISYILSFLSVLGAVAPSYYLVNENLKKLGLPENSRFQTTSIARGFAMAVTVSPAAATVGIALKYSGLSWPKAAGPFFLLSLAGLSAAFLVESSWRSIKALTPPSNPAPDPACSVGISGEDIGDTGGSFAKRLLSFFLLFAGVIVTISFLGNVLHFSSLNSISVGCLLVTFAWGALSGNLQPVLSGAYSFFNEGITKLSDQIVLFVAAGFFAFFMEHSGTLEWIGYFVEKASGMVGTMALLSMVPLIIILLSMVGLHPLASGIIIAKALLLSPLYLNPLAMAAALMSGMSMAYLVSPFTGLTLLLVSLSGKSPYSIGIRWNFFFMITFLLLTSLFITLATICG
jgi:hypothetical protein